MSQSMKRREFIKATAGGIMTAAVAGSVEAQGKKPKGPNLIYVFPDQMRGSAMGFLGEEPVKTPNLDRFAKECLVLTEAAATYPVCSPYRAMFMTGKYSHSNKVISNVTSKTAPYNCELQASDRCWTDVLHDRGYSLGYIGKFHLDSPRPPYIDCKNNRGDVKWNEWCEPKRRHGVDFWYSYGTYDYHMRPMYWSTHVDRQGYKFVDQWGPEHEADMAIKYINNEGGKFRDNDKPFAMVVSMNPPHTPYSHFPKRYKEAYADVPDEDLHKRPNIPQQGTKWGDHYRKNIRDYYCMITGVDDQFGRIVKAVDAAGLGDDTIIIFTSDHGDCVGINNMVTKNNHYEESFHVPFMIRWPGKIKPRQDDLLIATPDIYPTMLDLLGQKDHVPDEVEGVSHAEVFLDGKGDRPSSQLYLKIKYDHPAYGRRGLRTHRYTLCWKRDPKGDATVELYDRKQDPYQLKNIAESHPEVLEQLTTEMNGWLKKNGDPWLEV